MSDLGADALKIGMLGDAAIMSRRRRRVSRRYGAAVRPGARSGDDRQGRRGAACEARAIDALKTKLVPRAALVTPNAPEAARPVGFAVTDEASQKRAGEALLGFGAGAALIKGGHIDGDTIRDVLVTAQGAQVFEGERIETQATHGTGCTLASAIAVSLAQGISLDYSVERARHYLREAILHAPGFGAGHGPVDHGWPLRGKT